MFDLEDDNPSPGYWPSVSDLFITLFIIAIVILAAVFFALLPKNNVTSEDPIILAVGLDLGKIRKPVNELREVLDLSHIRSTQNNNEVVKAVEETCEEAVKRIPALQSNIERRLQKENRILKARNQKLSDEMIRLRSFEGVNIESIIAKNVNLSRQLHDQPPNIQFSEQKKDYHFGSSSSSMGPKFVAGLRKTEFKRLADEIVARQEEDRVKVDTLEIIGHTDGQPFSGGRGNLDQGLPHVLTGDRKISTLTPGSNNDLGLLRALAVREQWRAFIADHDHPEILNTINIHCYSAGQTILPFPKSQPEPGDFSQDDGQARRIEMRLTRLGAP